MNWSGMQTAPKDGQTILVWATTTSGLTSFFVLAKWDGDGFETVDGYLDWGGYSQRALAWAQITPPTIAALDVPPSLR